MNKISSLTTVNGRKLLHEAYKELRFNRQRSSLSTLGVMWKICTFEKNLNKYINRDVEISMPLGFFRGSTLWMEEIVNRFYFSTINSFVYFGAAILLVIIGLRRFDDNISLTLVFASIIFESVMLFFMFIVMLFAPSEESLEEEEAPDVTDDLLTEVGEIGRDFAAAVVQLEDINDKFTTIVNNQNVMLQKYEEIAKANIDASRPNPEMIEKMKETNEALSEFKETIKTLNSSVADLKKEQIESAVKKEFHRIITYKINKNE
jgi:hypothetical protein